MTVSYHPDMTSQEELVTVYRSADSNAEEDASAVREVLEQNGLAPVLCDDSVPGVVSGTWEVRVPSAQVVQAEALVNTLDEDDPGAPDPSHEFDSVTIAELQGATGEIEAMGIKSILDANEIPSVLVGNSTLPNLSFFIKVAATDVGRAEAALAEARAAGPAAAVEAERATEGQAPPLD